MPNHTPVVGEPRAEDRSTERGDTNQAQNVPRPPGRRGKGGREGGREGGRGRAGGRNFRRKVGEKTSEGRAGGFQKGVLGRGFSRRGPPGASHPLFWRGSDAPGGLCGKPPPRKPPLEPSGLTNSMSGRPEPMGGRGVARWTTTKGAPRRAPGTGGHPDREAGLSGVAIGGPSTLSLGRLGGAERSERGECQQPAELRTASCDLLGTPRGRCRVGPKHPANDYTA